MGWFDNMRQKASSLNGDTAAESAAKFVNERLPFEDAIRCEAGRMNGRRVYLGFYDKALCMKTPGSTAKKVMNVMNLGTNPYFRDNHDAEEVMISYSQITSVEKAHTIGTPEITVKTAAGDSYTFSTDMWTADEVLQFLRPRIG